MSVMPQVTDEYIASAIARLDAIEDERGVSCLTDGEALQRAALFELQQHRARIAAHAAAHPERLADDMIDACLGELADYDYVDLTMEETRSLLLEIQQRRAADLTPDEVETVREMLLEFEANHGAWAWEGGVDDAIAVCRKLLRAHGATP